MEKKTIAIIEKDASGYSVYTPDIEGSTIIGEGKTVAEAKEDFFNSVEEVKNMYTEEGKKLPEWLKDANLNTTSPPCSMNTASSMSRSLQPL